MLCSIRNEAMKKTISLPFAATTALLLGTILFGEIAGRRIPERLALPLNQIDSRIGSWTAARDEQLDPPTLRALSPTAYLSRKYGKKDSQLDLFIAYFAQQRAGESMHSPKHCLPGAGWEIWKHDSAWVSFNGDRVQINKYSIENMGTRMLMFYWYQSKDRIVANEYLGKVLLARDTLLTGHTAGSIVRIMLPDAPGQSEEGLRFASALIPQVQRCFGAPEHLASN
jgi:EpsI family protein